MSEPVLPDIIRHIEGIPDFLQDENLQSLKNQTADFSHQGIGTSSSLAVGVIFAAKPFWEIVTNPLVGLIVDRYF